MANSAGNRVEAGDPLETASLIVRRSQHDLLRKVAGSRRMVRQGAGHGSVSEVIRELLEAARPRLEAELAAAHDTLKQDPQA